MNQDEDHTTATTFENVETKTPTPIPTGGNITHKLLSSSLGIFSAHSSTTVDSSTGPVDQLALCQLLVMNGRWSAHMGHKQRGRQCLFIEEMMYLLMDGSLEVIYDDLPLSLAEGYALMNQTQANNGLTCPHSAFLTYSTLRTHGFIVMRPSLFHRLYSRPVLLTKSSQTQTQPLTPPTKKRKVNEVSTGPDEDPDSPPQPSTAVSSAIKLDPTSPAYASLFYTTSHLPPPQSKKQRRGLPKPRPKSEETRQRLDQEIRRLKEMQEWIKERSTPINTSSSSTTPTANSSIDLSVDPQFSSTIDSVLSIPCDFFYVWLPLGASLVPTAALTSDTNVKPRAFKKSEPSIPDYICLCTNPLLTYETIWRVLPHCSRTLIEQYASKRSTTATSSSTSSVSPSSTTACLGDVFSRLFQLSDEREWTCRNQFALDSTHPTPLMHLRIAVNPIEQPQRVFFIDADSLSPHPWLNQTQFPAGVESLLDIVRDDRKG